MKELAVKKIHELIDARIHEIELEIKETNDSKKNESKSSAGDKYETGREMIQQVLNNLESQLAKYQQMKNELSTINFNSNSDVINSGSLVQTDAAYFLISVALGKIKIHENEIFAISLNSPIGLAMKLKKNGDVITFQNRDIEIKNVS